jgi:hypothetical protein
MWLAPFRGRNLSETFNLNFLWNKDNVYIMDNHRAALWCWFQKISKDQRIDFFHIDKHYDALNGRVNEWIEACPDLWSLNLENYLSKKDPCHDVPLFRYDNYVSIFLDKYGRLINKCIFSTHKEGDKPDFNPASFPDIWNTSSNLNFWIEGSKNKWIVNIDLDYFFYESGTGNNLRLLSDDYIKEMFIAIKKQLENNKIACLTICLSPEFCGNDNWEASEKLCRDVTNILDIDFELPN